ncbi:MAG: S8 family serine peptidase [Gammaproteobacteria bacterium]|nr:S8 family serine peptidase [Gammaproteobacteria bacterium]
MKLNMKLACAATLLAMGVSAHAAQERVIVKFKDGKGPSVKAAAAKAGGELKVDLASLNAFAVEMPASALNGLRNNPNVEYVETDAKRYPLVTNLNNTEVTPYGLSKVQADMVSDALAANRKVCIIDSGYDISNSDLANNVVSGTNNSGTGNWYEAGGSHGTHVAGTIAAIANGSGVVGVMPNGKIGLHIIKVFNESGWGYSSSLIAAANECANQGSNVISMSLGGGSSSNTERNGFATLLSNGVLNIAAAGNDGNTAHSYPASYDSVMSVAAVDSSNQHANFSQRTSQVEISGPGEAVLSSVAGDGRLAQLDVGGTDYFANGVVPHIYYNSSLSYAPADTDGSASGTLGACTTSGTSYSCPSMAGKICLVERGENQGDNTSSTANNYPENRAADACADAGAEGIIVYSNAARPGLQAPFMVDFNGKISGIPTASVDRATGQALLAKVGQSASMSKTAGHDWEYYNGTSMATPHVSAVAALVWSHHTGCSATEVRDALNASALDLDTAGRDVKTGYGLVQAKAAVDYLATQSCGGGNPPSNIAPNASFTFSCTDLACSFDGSGSSDSDGSIASYAWSFGGAGVTANNTFASAGTYSVTLTVTDNEGATDTSTQNVTVTDGSEPPAADITLTGFRSKGNRQATINWTGATGTSVDVYVNGSFNNSTANDGSITYNVNKRSTYTFQVCETGSITACSNEITL